MLSTDLSETYVAQAMRQLGTLYYGDRELEPESDVDIVRCYRRGSSLGGPAPDQRKMSTLRQNFPIQGTVQFFIPSPRRLFVA